VVAEPKPATVTKKPISQPVEPTSDNNLFHRLDAKTLSDRMVESVNMVKTLMGTNRELR